MPLTDSTVVTTTSGMIRGRRHKHGMLFLSVPYAAPPIGAARFTEPRPHPEWDDVRDATRPGPTAPQPVRDQFGALDMSPYFGPGWRRGDDYLTVNVWAPRREGRPLPVMVFVHGGGFVAGSSHAPLYDGSAFMRDGVVLVTVNYRLGVPGFLRLPDAPDNRGLLDVLAALRWVHDNIGDFGGDSGNITLSGQSAGAILVVGALASPAASGLFRRAIVQSGSGTAAFAPEQAGIVTAAVGRELGVEPTAAALADVPDERFVAVLPRLNDLDLNTSTAHDPLGGITRFGLVSDQQPATTIAAGGDTGVDLLIGSNLEEGNLYLAPQGVLPGSPDVLGEALFGSGTRALAAAHASVTPGRTFRYEFGWRSGALDGQLGASHVMELPFVFDNLGLPSLHGPNALLGDIDPPAELATRMHRAWVRFATTGDPGWPGDSVVAKDVSTL